MGFNSYPGRRFNTAGRGRITFLTIVMKLANMVDLGSAGSNTLQVQVLPIVL